MIKSLTIRKSNCSKDNKTQENKSSRNPPPTKPSSSQNNLDSASKSTEKKQRSLSQNSRLKDQQTSQIAPTEENLKRSKPESDSSTPPKSQKKICDTDVSNFELKIPVIGTSNF